MGTCLLYTRLWLRLCLDHSLNPWAVFELAATAVANGNLRLNACELMDPAAAAVANSETARSSIKRTATAREAQFRHCQFTKNPTRLGYQDVGEPVI